MARHCWTPRKGCKRPLVAHYGLRCKPRNSVTQACGHHRSALRPSISGRRSPIVADVGTGLTAAPTLATLSIVSRPDGRSGKDRKVAGEESPGSMDMRCRITPGGDSAFWRNNLRESATENRPRAPMLIPSGGQNSAGKGETVR